MGYLFELAKACEQVVGVVRNGGMVVFVIARRSVNGRRVKTDMFLARKFRKLGFELENVSYRRIQRKNTPTIVNRNARGHNTKRTVTMRTESILVFRKTNRQAD